MTDLILRFWVGSARAAFDLGLPFQGTGHYATFGDYFTALVTFLVEIAGSLAVIVIVYAGLLYIRSQGKAEQISQAKELAAGALTGLALLLLIRFIVPTLNLTVK